MEHRREIVKLIFDQTGWILKMGGGGSVVSSLSPNIFS